MPGANGTHCEPRYVLHCARCKRRPAALAAQSWTTDPPSAARWQKRVKSAVTAKRRGVIVNVYIRRRQPMRRILMTAALAMLLGAAPVRACDFGFGRSFGYGGNFGMQQSFSGFGG